MSLKAVELQIALPRTQEVSRTQDQLQHRLTHGQQVIIEEQKQLQERKKNRTEEIQESAKGQIKDKQEKSKKERRQKEIQSGERKEQQPLTDADRQQVRYKDPLRGRHIDISL